MADKVKKTVKKAKVAVPPDAPIGVIMKFDDVPPTKRAKYPWGTVTVGECFDIPRGSTSSVSAAGKKYGKTFVVRDASDTPGCVRVFCTAVNVGVTESV